MESKKKHKSATVVGAGLAGCCMARLLAEKGYKVDLIEKSKVIGGLTRDCYHKGVLIHPYGPHTLRTNSKRAVDFLSRFIKWKKVNNYIVKAQIDGKKHPLPININTINSVFKTNIKNALEMKVFLALLTKGQNKKVKNSEDAIVSKIGRFLYELFFKNYTKKQWGIDAKDLDPEVCSRVPIRFDKNPSYFTQKYILLPKKDYVTMFKNMVNHPNIKIKFNKEGFDVSDEGKNIFIYTGPIDQAFNHKFGKLPYRSIAFRILDYNFNFWNDCVQINYPNENRYTREVELKHITKQKCKNTVVVAEFPIDYGQPMYPIPTKENQKLYQKYYQESKKLKNVYFIGRLAEYKYIDMDQVVDRCLDLIKKIK